MFLVLFSSCFCYSESFIRVFIRRNESPESLQWDIELQLMFHLKYLLLSRILLSILLNRHSRPPVNLSHNFLLTLRSKQLAYAAQINVHNLFVPFG